LAITFSLGGWVKQGQACNCPRATPVAPAVSILTAVRLRCAETAAVAPAAFVAAAAGLAAVVAVAVAGLEAASSE
jgi:hypothetical protein